MKKNSLSVLFIIMTVIVFLTWGISYAFLSYTNIGNKINSISTNGITFKYSEGNKNISLIDTMPITDLEGKSQTEYFEFTLSGYTDQNYELPYDITVRKTSDSSNIDDDIKLYLTSVDNNGVETEIKLTTYADINQYVNESIDLSNHSEKLLYSSKFASESSFSQKYRLRIWVSDNIDLTESKYTEAKFGLTVNVYGKGKVKSNDSENVELVPGLYDRNNNLLASWDELVNTYGLDFEKDYSSGKDFAVDENTGTSYIFKTNSMFGAILQNNPNLSTGSHLIISDDVTKIGANALLTDPLFSIVDCPATVTSIGSLAFGSIILNYTGPAVDSDGYNWGASVLNPYIKDDFAYSDNTMTTVVAYIGNSDSITIPADVTTIDDYAFRFHTEIKNLIISSNVVKINYGAFSNTGIETVTLEANSNLTTIDKDTFYKTPWFISESAKGKVYLNGIEVK